MPFLKVNFEMDREYNTEENIVIKEIGHKEYSLFGVSLYKKDYSNITNPIESKIKKDGNIGFKKK